MADTYLFVNLVGVITYFKTWIIALIEFLERMKLIACFHALSLNLNLKEASAHLLAFDFLFKVNTDILQ